MQCAPDPYEFFQSIFGLRAGGRICPLRANPATLLSEAEIEYAAGVTVHDGWLISGPRQPFSRYGEHSHT